MITRNLRNLMGCVPQSSANVYGMLPVTDITGMQRFVTPNFSFPGSRADAFTNNAAAAGISFGTGTTPATEQDYILESTITSGINVVLTSNVVRMDGDSPYHEFTFTVTNTGSEELTITEVGYKQSVKCAIVPGYTASIDAVVLLDRQVRAQPLVLQAGDAGVLVYGIKTVPPTKTVSGVKIVSFTYGTDEEVAAMIDAARAGTIDLQTDGGWAVGDTRPISLAAFTGGGNKAHAAQTLDIAISQFGDYMNCGCLFQFDFVEELATGQRMNSSNTNVGGYGGSEMKVTTLPAMVAALPNWLQTRLKTFDVLASAGGISTTIVTVSGNQLALRSEVEIFGNITYSVAGEGSQIEWYKRSATQRVKRRGRINSANYWWERSPYVSNSAAFCNVANTGGAHYDSATDASGLSPFGCI